jgi:hypothetical protein
MMDKLPSLSAESIQWYEAMIDAYHRLLSEIEKKELQEWEKENLGKNNLATSDWPGWQKYIGLPPWKLHAN